MSAIECIMNVNMYQEEMVEHGLHILQIRDWNSQPLLVALTPRSPRMSGLVIIMIVEA